MLLILNFIHVPIFLVFWSRKLQNRDAQSNYKSSLNGSLAHVGIVLLGQSVQNWIPWESIIILKSNVNKMKKKYAQHYYDIQSSKR